MERCTSIPQAMREALPILATLNGHGHEAVFVGGCVRDTVMGLALKDVDIATSATPEQVVALFAYCIPTGLQHGTVTVIQDGTGYEVTTYRKESVYEKHRRPESVAFISELKEDLLRRDLTINAMALHLSGDYYDPYGGMSDIQSKLVRCVGDAEARFQEDALRMLRALRFASQFSFRIVYRTWRALLKHRELLRYVAMERVQAELDKMLGGPAPHYAAGLLTGSGLLAYTLEPLPAARALLAESAKKKRIKLDYLTELDGVDIRYAALMTRPSVTLQEAKATLQALRMSGSRTGVIMAIVSLHHEMVVNRSPNEEKLRTSWVEAILRYGRAAAASWLHIAEANGREHAFWADLPQMKLWLSQMEISSLKELAINGNQLAAYWERKPGAWMGETLKQLLLLVALGELANSQEQLLKQVDRWKEETNES
ncbi:CCA tRNA nucleotidyltransferase [Paenibacillus algorifonticola]|uniref:CCA tRNA nucleotidyltransferase n=1 Tax=Paenibacillus algorifonticola TaxID=684063 RepID=UPI003D271795